MAAPLVANGLAFDARSLDALRGRAATDPKAAVRETARQFEALFMQELMKSMRASTFASMGEGGEDAAGARMGTEMLDTQYASQLSGLPGGLSEAIARHLERQMGLSPGPIPSMRSANDTPPPLAVQPLPTRIPQVGAAGFVQQHGAAAREAEAATGIPAAFMAAQAAHETGWGRKEIRHADGTPAFNLFGVKAGPGWRGPVAEVTTTEFVDGKAQKMVAKFRAYGSYTESFADYARLMRNSPRYQGVVAEVSGLAAADRGAEAASGFAQGLQRAGYATDPDYAQKLGRVINTTLRLQRAVE